MKYPAHWATTQMDDLLSRLQSPSDSDFKVALASPFFYHIPLSSPTDVTSQTFPDSVPSSVFVLSLVEYCKLFLNWLLYVQSNPPTKMQLT